MHVACDAFDCVNHGDQCDCKLVGIWVRGLKCDNYKERNKEVEEDEGKDG